MDESNNPLALFAVWMAEAEKTEPNDPNAMTLASVGADGAPSARIMLLKGYDSRGFVFYTNTESRKGRELAWNPRAALLFHWKTLQRQVRVEGEVVPLADAEADAYFVTRTRFSRIGAWASEQSRPLPDRPTLERQVAEIEARFSGQEVPRPPFWSGYQLVPSYFEFWQNRAGRLHERLTFTKTAEGWRPGRLYP